MDFIYDSPRKMGLSYYFVVIGISGIINKKGD